MAPWFRRCAVLMLMVGGALSVSGQAPTSFEVATIKPSDPASVRPVFEVSGRRISLRNQTVKMLLMYAYDVNDARIDGTPAWCGTERYDIDGTLATGTAEGREQVQKIVQALLLERFALKLHHDQRPMQAFVLRVANGDRS